MQMLHHLINKVQYRLVALYLTTQLFAALLKRFVHLAQDEQLEYN